MSLKKKYGLLASSTAVALLLAACAGDSGTGEDTGTEDTGTDEGSTQENGASEDTGGLDFPESATNEGEPIDGGTLQVALVAESAFPGIFSSEFSQINTDSQLMEPMAGSVLRQDENFQWTDGAASMDFNEEENFVTLTLQEGVLWHDGEELTVDDIVFAHEIVGHPDYAGVRYGTEFQNIEGMPEFKAGEADSVSGLRVIDDYTLEIQYVDPVGPAVYQAGGLYGHMQRLVIIMEMFQLMKWNLLPRFAKIQLVSVHSK